MIVSIVIDIPAKQVNRSFDYLVPDPMSKMVKLGMRVAVPFGNRQRTGFIVEIKTQTHFQGSLKAISGLIDYESYLNSELIELSQQMAANLHCFRISVLQAMLPNLLKVKYQEIVKIHDEQAFQARVSQWSDHHTSLTRKDLEAWLPMDVIEELSRLGVISLEYVPLDQTTQKIETIIKRNKDQAQLREILAKLDGRSHKQAQVIQYFIDHPHIRKIQRKDLMNQLQVSYASLQTMVEKEWLSLEEQEVYRNPLAELDYPPSQAKQLLPSQAKAYHQIKASIDHDKPASFLIEGVTGSGKTEVYLQLIEAVIHQGKSALLLVPEISLTPQMVERVVSRFQKGVAVLHSGLSLSEKYDEWQRIIKGEAHIVVGARSSVFAPLRNIGIIIIDEEHETTYKQGDNPRYHARDVAKWRSQYHHCPLVLGSATPSLESRARAEVGKYQLIQIKERVNQKPLPPVQIIDMTQEELKGNQLEFSQTLIEQIQKRLHANEQIVLLLNRRGYASYLLCRECGHVMRCPRCDISLTYHKTDQKMKCHYCDYFTSVPQVCPQCHSHHIRTHGVGTQKVAETLAEIFPGVGIIRMDNDTTRRKGQYKDLLDQFASGQADILLGTQMIAKGLDFENVTLVGVINADTALSIPDFRAGERTFQLLTQVSGRAGRGDKAGQVIIQTYNPDHYIMKFVQNHDYESFFYHEMKRRHLTHYPPYYFTTLVTTSSKNQGQALATIHQIKNQFFQAQESNQDLMIVGPSQNNISKINNNYYFNILLKYKDKSMIQNQLLDILEKSQESAQNHVYINIDHEPQFFI